MVQPSLECAPRRALVVGMKLSPACRERLTWIVAKLALPGDHVIAIHVLEQPPLPGFPPCESAELDPATRKELDETFQSVLGVYQGLCTLKQIKLDIKVVVGASVREVLVDTAKLEGATRLILGTSKFLPTGLSTSLAKYCLKKLSASCSVTIIDRGKVIFERPGYRHSGNPVVPSSVSSKGMKKLSQSDVEMPSTNAPPPPKANVSSSSSFSESSDMYRSFPASPDSVLASAAPTELSHRPREKPFDGGDSEAAHVSYGWPLCAISLSKVRSSCSSPPRRSVEKERELSVVHWAMQIPNRSRHEAPRSLHANKLSETLQGLCYRNRASTVSFSLHELRAATSNFSPVNLVGSGGCSKVYKGVLSSGQTVAVKCLTAEAEHEQLLTEVEILSSLRHRNVITLLGYCMNGETRMLVYNFAEKGSLEQSLHGEHSKRRVLSWSSRHKIAVSAARALEYLHDGSPRSVIHRDVKSSNILLSSDYDAMLSDFGLAKWAPGPTKHLTCTDVVGTFGYLAPEYFMFGKLDEKTDVYSFGVVLLELITGRHPIRGETNLVIWGRPLLEGGNMDKLVDPKLENEYDVQQMKQMIRSAALCLRQSPQSRPRMRKISKLLSGEEEIWMKNSKGKANQEFLDEFQFGASDVTTHLALALAGLDDERLCVS